MPTRPSRSEALRNVISVVDVRRDVLGGMSCDRTLLSHFRLNNLFASFFPSLARRASRTLQRVGLIPTEECFHVREGCRAGWAGVLCCAVLCRASGPDSRARPERPRARQLAHLPVGTADRLRPKKSRHTATPMQTDHIIIAMIAFFSGPVFFALGCAFRTRCTYAKRYADTNSKFFAFFFMPCKYP